MCLNPIQLRNPTKFISRYGGQPLLIRVGCGKCAECVETSRLQWRFRAYHHSENCINMGGFVYFDTLTYADSFLPRLSHFVDIDKYNIHDFSVFNHSHFKDFLKRLRRQLDYHYPGAKFEYFLTSEYGTDDRYTHRPHYHILFYVYPTDKLGFVQFSQLVSKCWYFGRTDGVPYQPVSYVMEHVYSNMLNNAYQCKNKVCNYVSKYVTKDSTFRAQIDKRINVIKRQIDDDETIKKLISEIDMFHRQSQGFGVSFIDTLDERSAAALYDGYVYMEDDKKVLCKIPTPMYYKRKLFYRNKKRVDGTRYWEYNDLGLNYHRKSVLHNVDRVCDKLYELYLNTTYDNQLQICKYLAGRTLQNFAVYLVLYKGRYIGNKKYKMDDINDYSLTRWIDRIQKSFYCNNSSYVYSVTDGIVEIPTELQLFGNNQSKLVPYETFIASYCISQNTFPQFANFDKLDSLFNSIRKPLNESKQNTFDFKEQLKKTYKQLIYGNN